MFNALKYIKNLESVGVSREQAEAHVELVMNAIEGEVATKSDISELKAELKSDISELKAELKSDISELRTEASAFRAETNARFAEIELKIAQLENRLMLKFGGLMFACMSLQTGIIGFLVTMKPH